MSTSIVSIPEKENQSASIAKLCQVIHRKIDFFTGPDSSVTRMITWEKYSYQDKKISSWFPIKVLSQQIKLKS